MIDQNTQNQSNNCKEWRSQLDTLKTKHAEFLDEYQIAVEQKSESNLDTAFNRCKKKKDEIKLAIQQLGDSFPPITRLDNRIKHLPLHDMQKEKLFSMISHEGYNRAVQTAKELDPSVQIPSYDQIIKLMLNLSREKLVKIAAIIDWPELIIVPDKPLAELIEGMNNNLQYQNQGPIQVTEANLQADKSGNVGIHIIDMVPHPKTVPGQKQDEQSNGEQYRICREYFIKNGMKLANARQYAAAMQISLHTYSKLVTLLNEKPEQFILDFRATTLKSRTMFDIGDISSSDYILDGSFEYLERTVFFKEESFAGQDRFLRGRGVVTLKE